MSLEGWIIAGGVYVLGFFYCIGEGWHWASAIAWPVKMVLSWF